MCPASSSSSPTSRDSVLVQPDRPAQTKLAFHASRIVIDAGVLLAMASMSMSFVVSDSGNRSALDADAFPAVLLLLPIFAVTLIPDHTRPLHPVAAWAALALGLAALPYAFVKMLDAGILADTLNGSIGLGSGLLVFGSLVTLVGIGIGLYRNLRGLPAGGTPGRSSVFRTRSKSLAAPGAPPRSEESPDSIPGFVTGDAIDAPPTRLLPVALEQEPAPESETRATAPSSQPEIVFPDTGAVARAADPDPARQDPLFDTAERADAAIDDYLLSMFDPGEANDTEPAE